MPIIGTLYNKKVNKIILGDLIKKIILKLSILFCLFFLFNISDIDSDNEKKLIYDVSKLYEKDNYLIYFKNLNSNEIDKFKKYNIEILSYLIDDKKYYARNSDILINEYTKEMNEEQKASYVVSGVKINAIHMVCTVEELIKIEKDFKVY